MRNFAAVIAILSIMGTVSADEHQSKGVYMTDTAKQLNTRDVVVTRVFDAPVERVWKAWSDSEQVMRWWGPHGFTSPLAKIDFREEGKSLVCMRSPDGQDMYNSWTYQKIVPNELIELIFNFTDKDGNKLDPAAIGMPPGIPKDGHHVITFKDLGNSKTEMTVTERGYTSDQVVELSRSGLEQCLDKMAASFSE